MTNPTSLSPRDRAVSAACLRIVAAHGMRHSAPALAVLPLTRHLVKACVEGIFEGIEGLAASIETGTAPGFDARIEKLLSIHLPKDPT